jgi:hypothetical protein
VLLALGAVAVLSVGVAWTIRRRRGPDDEALPPDQRIVRAWERAQRGLRRHGLGRTASETPEEFAARLAQLEQRSSRHVGADAVGQLAALVDLACYTPRPCTAGQAELAWGCAASVIQVNRHHH